MLPHERLEDDEFENREGHEWRYRLAAGFIESWDLVLDAACGTGYGKHLMGAKSYVGVDLTSHGTVIADLCVWDPPFAFDVAVSFETIEHLITYEHFIGVLKRANRWVIASVPITPTVGINPWHRHDFEEGDLAKLFVDDEWGLYQSILQPSEEAEVCVFKRK